MDLPALRTIPFLHENGLERPDSVLACSHRGWRGWLTASLAGQNAGLYADEDRLKLSAAKRYVCRF